MADPHIVSALVKKRAELAGEIEATHKRLGEMIEALDKLDDTLKLFDPDYEVEGVKPKAFRPPQDWAKRGEITRAITFSDKHHNRSQPARSPCRS